MRITRRDDPATTREDVKTVASFNVYFNRRIEIQPLYVKALKVIKSVET